MPAPKVFDDTNFHELAREGHQYGTGRVLPAAPKPIGFAAPFSAKYPRIPRSEWSARIKEQKERLMRISDVQKFKAHAQTGPTCWANGPAHAATTRRVQQGLSLIYWSANSISVPISGGNSGGWEWDAVAMMMADGCAPVDKYPNGSRDRALLRSSEVVESRKHFKILEALQLDDFDDYATACLISKPQAVAFNWWSHVISGADLVEIERGSFGLDFRNNWGEDYGHKNDYGFGGYVLLREGKGTPDSGCVIEEVTAYAA